MVPAPFSFEEKLFARQAAGVASERTVLPHHPMAGNDDAQGIPARRGSRGTDGMNRPGSFRQFGVSDCLPKRNQGNLPPDFFLEVCSGATERQGKICSRAVEILLKLPAGLLQNRMSGIERPVILHCWRVLAVQVINAGQFCSIGDHQQVA